MTQPTPAICWNADHVRKAISLQAKVDSLQSHYFLACHSPVSRLQDDRLQQDDRDQKGLTEEALYERIMNRRQYRDFLGLIHGEPGTGKSHLIHCLKLRCEYDLQAGHLKGVVPVLIRRRTGSLKDALEQLIEQLGDAFAKYLTPVKNALEKISAETAREKLANELSLEVGPRRRDRGKPPLSKYLRHLDQACKSGGFCRWLCRAGGVIDRQIRLLSQESTDYERDSPPLFAAADLKIEAGFSRKHENSGDVLDLILELQDSDRLCQEAAEVLNDALRDAIVEMTGLSGQNLRNVFDRIRQDLQASGRTLALFVEDVTAMSALDSEIVNAVEPQDQLDLCPLIAILGLTDTGMGRLPANKLQRVSLIVGVGADVVRSWLDNETALAAFTARYLNAIRLTESEVHAIAKHRRDTGRDVQLSKCDRCLAREECHRRFGAVTLGADPAANEPGVQVGMFPFSPEAPYHLLQNLVEDEPTEVRRNQRGLLMHLLAPILANSEAISNHEFPNEQFLRLASGDPAYWPQFQQRYCGGWSAHDKVRLRLLARMWIDEVESADQAAQQLSPLLEPLGFLQPFSSPVKAGKRDPVVVEPPEVVDRPPPPVKPPKAESTKVQRIRDNLRAWCDDKATTLERNAELRQLLAALVRDCVRWDDERFPPTSEWKRLVGGDDKQRYKIIYIEGQGVDPATAPFVIREEFLRSEETRELLEALVRFQHEGNDSWNFSGAELHKRVLARWLRRHEEPILRRLDPEGGLDTRRPITAAVQFLCTAAVVRRRAKLPAEPEELLEAVLADPWPEDEAPVALSKPWRAIVEDIRRRHQDVRDFVIRELAVTQGRTGGQNFIAPLPLLEAAKAFARQPQVEAVSADYFKGYWTTRYVALKGLSAYALPEALSAERDEVGRLVTRLTETLQRCGYETSNFKDAVRTFCSDLAELKKVKKETNFLLPDDAFDARFSKSGWAADAARWGLAAEAGCKVAESHDPLDVLVFDPRGLQEAEDAIRVAERHVVRLQKELADQDRHQTIDGDPLELRSSLLDALETVAGLLNEKEARDDALAG